MGVSDEIINAPTQNFGESFETQYPCNNNYPVTYEHLLDWWQDWTDCVAPTTANDSNILITSTNQSDGGRAGLGGTNAVAQTGQYVAQAPINYEEYGDGLNYSAIETVLHEIGHNLTQGDIKDQYPDVDNAPHKIGDKIYHSDIPEQFAHTVLATSNSANVCGDSIGSSSYWEMNWSICCEDHWREDY